eukprot:CAMPEP_0197026154 /NCGR_PEP_ID=MMETSP1384-20130603/6316_1 /TAXON_ID=29189 /ORGANISM="Ammonia sp." /LENGTH=745 /DNA_ID=CAMNT_0042454773 /DNA_START=644 /DNA_END=2881 /DNA_ORIENTATION=-
MKQQQARKEKAVRDRDKTLSQKFLKYIHPKFILTKLGSLVYHIVYYTVDSIVHPSRGKERIQSLWKSIKREAKHFWEGSKLMWTDLKTARRILMKFARGNELTYRERRQLRRVAMDVLRFVPMVIIILIPFLEAALPILLVVFPNMLPSRFQSEHMKLERRKKLLSARIGLASFFEDTLEEFVKETKRKEEYAKMDKVESLEIVLEKIRNNEEITNTQIMKVASLFDDEMALDNAPHSVLANMCRYMQLNSFGTTAMLRQRLYDKIRQIRTEDAGIRKEGLDNIPEQLLKQLLRERGMRSDFQDWVLRANLNKWLELSLDHDVPVTLLIMSRIFTLQHIPGHDTTEMLKDTISTIGEQTTKEMLVEKGAIDDMRAEKEIIERQQQLIAEEEALEQAEKAEKERKEKEEKEMTEKEAKEKEMPIEEEEMKKKKRTVTKTKTKKRSKEEEEEEIVNKKRIRDLAESVEALTAESAVDPEKQEIEEIKEKLKQITEETEALWEELVETREKLQEDFEQKMEEIEERKEEKKEEGEGEGGEEEMPLVEQVEAEILKTKEEMLSEQVVAAMEEVKEIQQQFEVKEDVMQFDDESTERRETRRREKTTDSLSKRIEKIIEKSAVYADETGLKFANTLKRFADNVDDIKEGELKEALKSTLNESASFTDKEIEQFLKALDEKRRSQPETPLYKIIAALADDYYDVHEREIDIKDIKWRNAEKEEKDEMGEVVDEEDKQQDVASSSSSSSTTT